MASAVQWPERWIRSYSGTAELICISHEGLRGSPFLYLGVKKEQKGERRGNGGGEEEGKEEYRREKRRGNMRRKRRKDAQLKMPCPEGPRYILPFPLLSVVFRFQAPPTTPHGCMRSRQSLDMPSQPPCLLVTLTSSQLASRWFSDRNCDGTRSNLACCKQIKLLKIRWGAVWQTGSKIQRILSVTGSRATQQSLISLFPWPQLLSLHNASRETCPCLVPKRDLLGLIKPDNSAFAERINTRHAHNPSACLEFLCKHAADDCPHEMFTEVEADSAGLEVCESS